MKIITHTLALILGIIYAILWQYITPDNVPIIEPQNTLWGACERLSGTPACVTEDGGLQIITLR